MKLRYTFVTDETIEIEVPDDIGAVVVESRHQEELNDRKESRRHYHYDADDVYEGSEYGAEEPGILALFTTDAQDRLALVMSVLTDNQREVIKALYIDGLSGKEYAARKGISEVAVTLSKRAAMKKMKEFFAET